MDLIAGMQPTGRRVQGPGFELVGLDGERGAHTAIVWTLPQRTGVELGVRDGVRAFLERPGFAGLARLVAVDRTAGAAVFATGEVWSAAEVLASLRRRGRSPGLRAGLELAWQAAELLARAHREAGPLGAPCHGAVDPWRLAVRRDGQVVLLGFDVLPARLGLGADGAALAEALRYAPPERIDGRDEDATCDLFGLALVALEWIVGEPVYAGSVEQIRDAAREAEGDRVLWAWRERVPKSVAAVLGRAIRRDVDARWPDAASFATALRQELGAPDLDGPSLHALLSSKDLDPPTRFVALEEERGDVDTRAAEPVVESPSTQAAPVRARIVSLGGRLGRASRVGAPSAPGLAPPEPPSMSAAPPAPPEAPVAPLVEPPPAELLAEEAETVETTRGSLDGPAPLPGDDAPDATYAEVDEDDAAALAELMDAPVPGGASGATVPVATSTPTTDGPPPEVTATTSTVWEPVGPVTLSARTPDGPVVQVTVDPELPAARAALALVLAAGLPRLDSNGRVSAVWRLTRDGAPVTDRTRAVALADGALVLVRTDARLVPVRVRVAARVVEANVSTALFAVEAAAALAGVGGLASGRALRVDGVELAPDALLDGLVKPGVTVEIDP